MRFALALFVFLLMSAPMARAQEISGDFAGGSVKVGPDTATCDTSRIGAMHMNGATLEYCNGTCWKGTSIAGAPSDGLIALWTFDEGTGTTADDSIGANTGTLINAPVWTTAGRIGGALTFSGNRYVSVPSSANLNLTSFTIAGWGRMTTVQTAYIMEKGVNGSTSGPYLFYTANTLICGFNGSSAFQEINSGFTPSANTWYHYACSYNSASKTLKLYVNGSAVEWDTVCRTRLPIPAISGWAAAFTTITATGTVNLTIYGSTTAI